MPASARSRSSESANAPELRVLALGSRGFISRLKEIFVHSRWTLEGIENEETARNLLEKTPVPAVLCDRDWTHLAAKFAELPHPPSIIAIDFHPSEARCLDAVKHGIYYVDVSDLSPAKLFPVINHAWQIWAED